ncbi:hypothetical protein ONZ45_g17121 [Pleurotus djamor]|nr:hypothetical protein ONZ45_g17121 [Pleurotus djamor]
MDGRRQRPLLIVALVSALAFIFIFAEMTFLPMLGTSYPWPTSSHKPPDFSLYKVYDTLSVQEFPLDPSSHRRAVIVGDIHGMNRSFHSLLKSLNYNEQTDSLIFVGDILAKGPHKGSMAVLSYMAEHNVTGVRGNHDQKIIEWRGWIDWVHQFPDGKRWLIDVERDWNNAAVGEDELDEWTDELLKKRKSRWSKTIPKGWVIFGDHYRIARAMSKDEYAYLLALPLKLHIPHAHAFIVHAGLLPLDPRYKASDSRQPLAHVPKIGRTALKGDKYIEKLRQAQELSVANDLKQNANPWVNLNMRGVTKNHDVTRSHEGKPWSELWNRDMEKCDGFDLDRGLSTNNQKKLPCYPATVIYGHAASRGLDVKRWSIGLDSGCVYGRSMTALVLGSHKLETDAKPHQYVIPFSDDAKGRIVYIDC